jgi:predicted RNase H-like HicB family nuclease
MNILRPTDAGSFEVVRTNGQTVTVSSGFTFVNSISSGSPLESKIEPNTARYVPQGTFARYVHGAMKLATFEKMEDGSYISEVPGFSGVWGTGDILKDCLDNLDEVLREWLLLKIKDCDTDIPIIENINLNNL